MKTGFIGCGNMGSALAVGICKAISPAEVIVFDRHMEKIEKISDKTGCATAKNAQEICEKSEYIVVAVKPQMFRDVLKDIIPFITENHKIISIAAGISVSDIQGILKENGKDIPVIRMLPNTPSEVGEGLNIYCESKNCDDKICKEVEHMFKDCGLIEKVSEKMVDMASAISGCTPAFAYMFIDALADGAVRCGVPRDKAIRYAAQAVKGAAAMVLETGRHPGELKDAVCSPAGSTIVGVATLEDSAFRSAAANAVYNANEKNKSLGK